MFRLDLCKHANLQEARHALRTLKRLLKNIEQLCQLQTSELTKPTNNEPNIACHLIKIKATSPLLLFSHPIDSKGENDMTGFEQTYLITVLACFGAFALVLGLTDLATSSVRK